MAKQRTDTESVINLVINGNQAMTSLKELTDTQRKLNAELRNMKPSDPGFKKIADEARMVTNAISEQKKAMSGLSNESSKFSGIWKQVGGGLIAADIASKAVQFLSEIPMKIVEAYAVAEKNRAVLTNALNGDAKLAGESLNMLMEFASKTPFAMNEAVDSYIKLVNRGIIPTREEMVKLGDIAASQGKSMDMLVEAILDAQTGEMERLKEFGIRGKKNGDMVAFSFKGVTKEVKFTEEAIKDALLSYGEMAGVSGTMETVSNTIVGLQSNISDTWDQIYTKLGQKSEGIINGIYSLYSKALSWINEDLLSLESAGQRMVKSYNEQSESVNNLTKNISPLLNRYDELKTKGNLNKTEQQEIKEILEEVSNTIPTAINQWNNLGDAMDINTAKAKEFIASQRAMLIIQNKETVGTLQNEIEDWTKSRDAAVRRLNSGYSLQNTGGSSTMLGTTMYAKLTPTEIAELKKQIIEYNKLIKLNSDAIAGLNGNQFIEETKTPTVKVESKVRTEGVIKKEIESLEKLRSEVAVASKEYKAYTKDIERLQDELSNAKGKKTTTNKQLEKLEDERKKLKDLSTKMALEVEAEKKGPLEKTLNKISQEYDPLIKKAREFKDEVTASLFEKTKKSAEDIAKSDYQKVLDDEEKARKEKEFARLQELANINREKSSNELVDGYINELEGVSTDQQAFELKEKYRLLEEQATEEHLLALKMLYEAYGKDTTQLDTELTNIRLGNAEREAQGKIEWTLAKQEIESAYVDLATQGIGVLMGLVDKQSGLYKGLLILDKALAIAKIITNTQVEIAGYFAKYALVPGGAAIAAAQSAAAKVRAGISIGIVAATGIAELASTKKGGDSYAIGVKNAPKGKKLVGEAGTELIESDGKFWLTDGPQLVDFKGGENVYNASETAKMYTRSLYPVQNYSINTTEASNAERYYRSVSTLGVGGGYSIDPNISRLIQLIEDLALLQAQESEKKVVLDYSAKERYEKELEFKRSIQMA